ncbi:hypothetical protein BB558_000622 [Smittium angustum]|uniref:Bromo domain-containing protein n=1 Tax=Smittium angustum TaxID=133377 RepID=A0A2U1JDY0_SMIAN|nr:hypothetical protein BB558_000622 [Smittium angustum]
MPSRKRSSFPPPDSANSSGKSPESFPIRQIKLVSSRSSLHPTTNKKSPSISSSKTSIKIKVPSSSKLDKTSSNPTSSLQRPKNPILLRLPNKSSKNFSYSKIPPFNKKSSLKLLINKRNLPSKPKIKLNTLSLKMPIHLRSKRTSTQPPQNTTIIKKLKLSNFKKPNTPSPKPQISSISLSTKTRSNPKPSSTNSPQKELDETPSKTTRQSQRIKVSNKLYDAITEDSNEKDSKRGILNSAKTSENPESSKKPQKLKIVLSDKPKQTPTPTDLLSNKPVDQPPNTNSISEQIKVTDSLNPQALSTYPETPTNSVLNKQAPLTTELNTKDNNQNLQLKINEEPTFEPNNIILPPANKPLNLNPVLINDLFEAIYSGNIKQTEMLIEEARNQNVDLDSYQPVQLERDRRSVRFSENGTKNINSPFSVKAKPPTRTKSINPKNRHIDTLNASWTPLQAASYFGRCKIISLLLESGMCDVEKRDTLHESTALIWAAYGGHSNALRKLVFEGNANINAKNIHGQTPIDLVPNPENPKWLDILTGRFAESARKRSLKKRIEANSSGFVANLISSIHSDISDASNMSVRQETVSINNRKILEKKWKDIDPEQKSSFLANCSPDTKAIVDVYESILDYSNDEEICISEEFQELPDEDEYPEYYEIFKHPVSLDVISERILSGRYSNFSQFDFDMQQIFHNACFFNEYGSDIYADAVELLFLYIERRREAVKKYFVNFDLPIAEQKPPRGRYVPRIMCGDLDLAVGDCIEVESTEGKPKIAIILRLAVSGSHDENMTVDGMWFSLPLQSPLNQIRMSYPHEVVLDPTLFTGFPAEKTIRRCAILPLKTYTNFYPESFDKSDLYVCEYSIVPNTNKLTPLTVWPSPSPLHQPPDHYFNFIRYTAPLHLKRVPFDLWENPTFLPNPPNKSSTLSFSGGGLQTRVPISWQPNTENTPKSGISIQSPTANNSSSLYRNQTSTFGQRADYSQQYNLKTSNNSTGLYQASSSFTNQGQMQGIGVYGGNNQNLLNSAQANFPPPNMQLKSSLSGNPGLKYYPETNFGSGFPNNIRSDTGPVTQTTNELYNQQAVASSVNINSLPGNNAAINTPKNIQNKVAIDEVVDDTVIKDGLRILESEGESRFVNQLKLDTLDGKTLAPLTGLVHSGLYCLQIKGLDSSDLKATIEDYSLSLFQQWDIKILHEHHHSIQVPLHVSQILLRPVYPLFNSTAEDDSESLPNPESGFLPSEDFICTINLKRVEPRDIKNNSQFSPKSPEVSDNTSGIEKISEKEADQVHKRAVGDTNVAGIEWRKNIVYKLSLLPGLNIIKLDLHPPQSWKRLFQKLVKGGINGDQNLQNENTLDSEKEEYEHLNMDNLEVTEPIRHTIFITRV